MPVTNIYNAAYSLQVWAGGGAQPWVVAWTQETVIYRLGCVQDQELW